MFTLTELCTELSITPATGRNWVKLGKIKPEGKKGRTFTFSDEYVRSLKADLESGKLKSLRSRRNKSYVSGNLLYSSYIADSSPNLPIVQKLVMDIAALHSESAAADSEGDTTNENSINTDLLSDDRFLCAILSECAKGLISSRISTEDYYKYKELLDDINRKSTTSDTPENNSSNDDANLTADLAPIIDKLGLASAPLTYVAGEDTLGLIYISLKHLQTRKSTGAYYTPGKIVQRLLGHLFEAAILTDGQDKVILDPGCGSGNFLLCLPPGIPAENIYGYDTDEISVKLSRLNLALKYRLPDMAFWQEHISIADFLHQDPEAKQFDIILGNPPWGSTFSPEERAFLKDEYGTAAERSLDSYDLFIEQGIRLLKNGGALSLVLPESVLLVKSHTLSRRLLLEKTKLTHLEYLGDVFDHVQCPSIILQTEKKDAEESFLSKHPVIYDGDASYQITSERKISDTGFDFLVPDEEYALLESLASLPDVRFLEGNAEFALGIVTGANKDMLKSRKSPKNEIILKGTDIFRYSFKEPKCYIAFAPEKWQQVAPISMYRAPEKLLYRFIGGHLVFAYDDKKTLSLNSCNIVIPNIENLSTKYILAILNSSVSEYFFRKRFRSVKILRSHIEKLPIPYADKETQKNIESKIDQILTFSRNVYKTSTDELDASVKVKELYNEIDEICFELFKLTPEKIALIKQLVKTENLFLPL
ncbi:TaqI-like C-terminal specificity domain-containing protein [Butyrivibrio sp. FC2001]|uniref:TaqI-like C-terminal specificity domain-containing protein n=1 Tax=Butyrivibrio sp. FC2001 TaxID=1280671 RepID=UPI0003FE068C|nr:TaqI-like C-terminal specificity domain-containing protein [Butyrivibrio sp. FC2001]